MPILKYLATIVVLAVLGHGLWLGLHGAPDVSLWWWIAICLGGGIAALLPYAVIHLWRTIRARR